MCVLAESTVPDTFGWARVWLHVLCALGAGPDMWSSLGAIAKKRNGLSTSVRNLKDKIPGSVSTIRPDAERIPKLDGQ